MYVHIYMADHAALKARPNQTLPGPAKPKAPCKPSPGDNLHVFNLIKIGDYKSVLDMFRWS